MKHTTIPLVLVGLACFAPSLYADAPPKLKEMQGIFQEERIRVMRPLVMKYIVALERQQDEATRAADLDDAALAFRQEAEQLKRRFAFALPKDTPPADPSGSKSAASPTAKAVRIVNEENPSVRTGSWKGALGEASYKAIAIKAIAKGDTQGDIILHREGGEDVKIYSWTGKEKTLTPKALEDGDQLVIEVTEHMKTGDSFSVTLRRTGGSGSLHYFTSSRMHRR